MSYSPVGRFGEEPECYTNSDCNAYLAQNPGFIPGDLECTAGECWPTAAAHERLAQSIPSYVDCFTSYDCPGGKNCVNSKCVCPDKSHEVPSADGTWMRCECDTGYENKGPEGYALDCQPKAAGPYVSPPPPLPPAVCPKGTTGTPPNCVTIPTQIVEPPEEDYTWLIWAVGAAAVVGVSAVIISRKKGPKKGTVA